MVVLNKMVKISRLEKIAVTILNPLDFLAHRIAASCGERIDELHSIEELTKHKLDAYNLLLIQLGRSYDRHFVLRYMGSPCGSIQVKLAEHRGLIPKGEYKELRKERGMFEDFLDKDDFGMV